MRRLGSVTAFPIAGCNTYLTSKAMPVLKLWFGLYPKSLSLSLLKKSYNCRKSLWKISIVVFWLTPEQNVSCVRQNGLLQQLCPWAPIHSYMANRPRSLRLATGLLYQLSFNTVLRSVMSAFLWLVHMIGSSLQYPKWAASLDEIGKPRIFLVPSFGS